MNREMQMTGALRPDVEVIRGDPMLLFDRQKDAYFKFDEKTLKIISYLSESMPVEQFLQNLLQNGIRTGRVQLIEILTFLRQNDLLQPDPGEIVRKKAAREEYLKKNWLLRISSAYLFFRLPPWRPEHFFERIAPFARRLTSGKLVLGCAAVALCGYLLLIRDFSAAVTEFRNSLSWAGLVKYFFAIAAVKFLHESAHALAALHFRCRIRGIGIGFMFFIPRLYTDTTDSWRLPRKQRLLIDSAGIAAELFIGGAAALLWSFLPPGILRSTLFYILTVSTLSTFAVNGNPFIKYDGYYILCDLVGQDNLMGRAAETVRQYFYWYFLRIGKAPDLAASWKIACFGVCSFLYRIFLYTSIILVIYHKFNRVLAVLMILLEIYAVLLHPLYREIKTVYSLLKREPRKKLLLTAGVSLLLVFLLLLLPFGWTEELPGEVCAEHRSIIVVPESGFLLGDVQTREVRKGDVLCRMRSPKLQFLSERIEKQEREETLLLRLQRVDEKQFSEAELTAAKLKNTFDNRLEIRRKQQLLTVRSPLTGTFVPLSREMRAGKYLPKNTTAGHVFSAARKVVAYAGDQQLGQLSAGQEVKFYLHGDLSAYPGRIRSVSNVPATLESSALLQPFGGVIPVVEQQNDRLHLRPCQTLYRVEIELTGPVRDLCLGRVAKVCIRKEERLLTMILRIAVSIWRKEFCIL